MGVFGRQAKSLEILVFDILLRNKSFPIKEGENNEFLIDIILFSSLAVSICDAIRESMHKITGPSFFIVLTTYNQNVKFWVNYIYLRY